MEVKLNVHFRFSLAGADHSVSHETKHVNTIFLQKHLHLDLKNKHKLKSGLSNRARLVSALQF